MSAASKFRFVEESTGWQRRRRVPQASTLGGHYFEYPKVGSGERGHVGFAVACQDGDGGCRVPGVVPG